MRKLLVVASLLISGQALALDDATKKTLEDMRDKYRGCLFAQSVVYGEQSCHAPSELLPAVFASCKKQENAVLEFMDSATVEGASKPIVEEFKEKLKGDLVVLIVHEQSRKDCK